MLASRSKPARMSGALVVAASVSLWACDHKGAQAPDSAPSASVGARGWVLPPAPSRPPERPDLVRAAEAGDHDALERLALDSGQSGLSELGRDPAHRAIAIAAMPLAPGYDGLAFLAEVAQSNDEALALSAIDAIRRIAAQPQTPTERSDALYVIVACDAMRDAAGKGERAEAVRAAAKRALAQLAELGCRSPAPPADAKAARE